MGTADAPGPILQEPTTTTAPSHADKPATMKPAVTGRPTKPAELTAENKTAAKAFDKWLAANSGSDEALRLLYQANKKLSAAGIGVPLLDIDRLRRNPPPLAERPHNQQALLVIAYHLLNNPHDEDGATETATHLAKGHPKRGRLAGGAPNRSDEEQIKEVREKIVKEGESGKVRWATDLVAASGRRNLPGWLAGIGKRENNTFWSWEEYKNGRATKYAGWRPDAGTESWGPEVIAPLPLEHPEALADRFVERAIVKVKPIIDAIVRPVTRRDILQWMGNSTKRNIEDDFKHLLVRIAAEEPKTYMHWKAHPRRGPRTKDGKPTEYVWRVNPEDKDADVPPDAQWLEEAYPPATGESGAPAQPDPVQAAYEPGLEQAESSAMGAARTAGSTATPGDEDVNMAFEPSPRPGSPGQVSPSVTSPTQTPWSVLPSAPLPSQNPSFSPLSTGGGRGDMAAPTRQVNEGHPKQPKLKRGRPAEISDEEHMSEVRERIIKEGKTGKLEWSADLVTRSYRHRLPGWLAEIGKRENNTFWSWEEYKNGRATKYVGWRPDTGTEVGGRRSSPLCRLNIPKHWLTAPPWKGRS
jgi:hypothetical protein